MGISTKGEPVVDKRQKLKDLRKLHQPIFEKLNIPNAQFIPKMAYQPYGKTERHMAFFPSEINRGEDIYTEVCSKELNPEDPQRRLWKWTFNPHYQEEYDVTEAHKATGHVRYLIPVAELELVNTNFPTETISEAETASAEQEFELTDPDSGDIPIDQMTIRDYAAIHLGKPVSNRKWLNEIIEKE